MRIDQDSILQHLEDIRFQTSEGIAVYDDDTGQVRDIICRDFNLSLKALDQQAKLLGLYKENVRLTGADGGPIKTQSQVTYLDLKSLTTEELKVMRAALVRQKEAERLAAAKPIETVPMPTTETQTGESNAEVPQEADRDRGKSVAD